MPGNCSPYKKNSSPNRLEPIFCLSCNHETQIQRQHNKIHNSRFWSVYIFTRTNCCYFLIKVLWLPVCPPWLNYFWPSLRLPRFFGARAPRMSHFHAYPPVALPEIYGPYGYICTFLYFYFHLLLLLLLLCSMNCISAALPEICRQQGYL